MFWTALGANLLLRIWLASLPGYTADVQAYKRWALGSALGGLPAAYETVDVDYPPAYLYVLHGIGTLYLWIEAPGVDGEVRDSTLLTLLIKLPTLFFDLVVAGLLLSLVGRWRLWGSGRDDPGWGRWAAVLYLWNPAVLWSSGYWGQPDAVHTAAVVAAVALLVRLRWFAAGAVLATGALVKPLAAPFVPLAAVASGLADGWRGMLRCAAGGLGATALVFLPFAAADRLFPTLGRV
ncbi:MAG: glycosyltransferase 87 family protein, partial [Myxococcota bacterium]|nr:glycosyltransferase 87 family protein [Myxococcota bacterium]